MSYIQPPAAELPHGASPLHAAAVPVASAGGAVSWGAIFAGATAAAALSLLLLLLGSGLGLSSASPWASQGASAAALGIAGIFWITFTQLAASGIGGYLAGRLRSRWVSVHSDEVYFRDTAHGFLAWSVATLVTAAFLTSAVGAILGTGAKAGAAIAGAGATAGAAAVATARPGGSELPGSTYFLDALFRPAPAASADAAAAPVSARAGEPLNAATVTEVGRILANSIRADSLPAEDLQYVGGLVAQRTGLSQQEAEQRVSATYTKVKTRLRDTEATALEAADKARKASAYSALWLCLSLFVGAFIASICATWGGRRRDA